MEKDVINKIDETIKVICKRIQETEHYFPNEYPEIVKALAGLVTARALLKD